MKIGRCSGILLHPTSLPGDYGIGDLGPESRRFVDLLEDAKQKLWCLLPVSPTGPQNSPYECCSTFAGSPLLISPELLVEHGYLSRADLRSPPHFPLSRVDYPAVRVFKEALLKKAFRTFRETKDYAQFASKYSWWLHDYAHFMALSEAHGGAPWTEFDPQLEPSELAVRFHKFVQYEFFRQWYELRKYCAKRKIAIMGDMSFYVEHNSADVWSNQQLFDLRNDGTPRNVGGVPPDYFSKNGQLWGTPVYRWDRMKKQGFRWWINRFKSAFELMDLLRLDHFRGFEAYWSVPAHASTAKKGRWVKGPGAELFDTVSAELGEVPIVAENLGIITPEVEALRHRFGFPGMAVLQFAFDESGMHRPNNYVRELVSFTGTHDNDTTQGWWTTMHRAARARKGAESRAIVQRVKSYLQRDGREIHWSFIQAVLTSVADIAIVPLQDVLGLGAEARMNLPGRAKGNWRWRFRQGEINRATVKRLRDLTLVSGR